MRLAESLVAAAACVVLASCGGGGGQGAAAIDDQPVVSTLDFPVDAAITRLFVEGGTFEVYATAPTGVTLHLREEWRPAPDQDFGGSTWRAANGAIELRGAGELARDEQRVLFSTNPLRVEAILRPGFVDAHTGRYGDLPTSAKVGASGPFIQTSLMGDQTFPVPISITTTRWSLKADTEQTALACMEFEAYDVASETISGIEVDCYRIDSTGAILGMEVDITVNGQTLKFR